LEKRVSSPPVTLARMINALTHAQVWVLDQDEALEFYVGRLGLEVHTDADLGSMRWLTVNVPGRPETQIMLLTPGPPGLDPATAEQVRELVTKGAAGALIFKADDCRATYEALCERGVEFTQEPEERFYGTDCALRDPFGNPVRITEPAPEPVVPPGA
jgi:catechol 2,3-dioxygenase-like lactoylglutathione lyase family enzyme